MTWRLAIVVGLWSSLWPLAVRAESDLPIALDRIDVPANRPDLWPAIAEKLIAVPRVEFERLWESLRPKAPTLPAVVLESLELEATLVGSTLTAGSGRLKVQHTSNGPTWMSLDDTNLAISAFEPVDSSSEVPWGAAEDGKFWFHADPEDREYAWAWSLSGKSIANRLLFDLELPSVMRATLKLRIPESHHLSSPQVAVRRITTGAEAVEGWSTWEVLAGSERSLRLIVEQTAPVVSAPVVLYRRQLGAVIREDHLRFEATFFPEVLGGDVSELPFVVPKGVELYSVTWGRDVPLVWSRTPLDGLRNLIRVRLPDAQSGTLRTMRLEGIVSQRPGSVATLPQIDLQGGIFRSGSLQVSITRPLEVVSLRTLGCRQESPALITGEGETYQFQQTMPTSRLTFEVRRPRSSLKAHIFSTLVFDTDEWTWENVVTWSSISGSAFQLSLRVPPGWEVMNVRSVGTSPMQELSWDLTEEPDNWSRVAIELLEALTPDRPSGIRIQARRTAPAQWSRVDCPMLLPVDCQSVHRVTRVLTGDSLELYPDAETSPELVDPSTLPLPWKNLPSWSTLVEGFASESAALWFRHSDPAPAPALTRYERLQPLRGEVELQVEVADGLLTETYRVTVAPLGEQPLTRVLVALSEPGDDIAWEVEQPQDWRVIGSRIPVDHQPSRDREGCRELWELRLPDPKRESIVLVGVRARQMSLPAPIGLATLPQAEERHHHITLSALDPNQFQTIARGLDEIVPESHTLLASQKPQVGSAREWRYRTLLDEFSLISRGTSLLESPCMGRLDMTSQISAFEHEFDEHRATITLSSFPSAVRIGFSHPVEVLQASLGTFALTPGIDGTLVVPPETGDSPRTLEIVYRSRGSRGFLMERRTVPMPVSAEIVWTGLLWDFSLPPGAELSTEPRGVRLSVGLRTPTWSDRLFGPMSRTAQHRSDAGSGSIFLPWRLESWRELSGLSITESQPSVEVLANPLPTSSWHAYQAFAPAPVERLELRAWHRGRMTVVSWLCLAGSLMLTVTVRAFEVPRRAMFAAIWLAVWTGVAYAVEPPLVSLVGGVLAGSFLGWLTPRPWLMWQWIRPRPLPEVPAGSTQSFVIPKELLTTILVLACGLAAVPTGYALASLEEFDPDRVVLVPVDEMGNPTALVYVSPQTLERLNASSKIPANTPPTTLIQLADYRGTLGVGQRVAVTARFEVLVLGQQSQVNLPLPVSSFGPASAQSCTVDHVPATITVLPDRSGFQVAWTRGVPGISAIQAASFTRHNLQLEWQHAWHRESGLAIFETDTPFAAIARWRVAGLPFLENTDRELIDPEYPADVRVDGAVSRELGMSNHFRVRWRETGPVAEPVEVQVETREAIAFSVSLTDVRSRTTFRPRTGVTRRVSLDLPVNSVVRKWTSSIPAELVRVTNANALNVFQLEFAEPLVAPATVDIEFVVPTSETLGEFRWLGLQWRGSEGSRLTHNSRTWALYAPEEIRIQPQSLEASRLVPLTLEGARELFVDQMGDRVPRAAYQVSGTDPIIFQTALNLSIRRQLLWQQSGTIEGDVLRWETEGEVELEGPPVYSHVLTVDRRLNIESISVRERGAERLVRWSETRSPSGPGASRITLFLSDPAVEAQRIKLVGSIPINPAASIPLPNVRCEDTQFSGGRVLLKTAPGVELIWAGARGLKELTEPEGTENSAGAERIRIFDQVDADWRATVRILTEQESLAARSVHMVSSDNPQTLECRSLWRLPQSRLQEPATLIIPSPWEIVADSGFNQDRLDIVRSLDGTWNVTVQGDERTEELLLNLRLRVQRSALRGGLLPLPHPVGELAQGYTGWLAELTRMPQSQLLADDTSALDHRPPADWESGAWQEAAIADNERLRWWRLSRENPFVRLAAPQTSGSTAQIEWLEHLLWCEDSGVIRGATLARLAQPISILVTRIPEPLEFRASLMGDVPGVTRSEPGNLVQMSRRDGQPFSEVWLLWQEPLELSGAPVIQEEASWPQFPQANVRQLAVTAFPIPGTMLRGTGPWIAGDWVDRSMLRLEVLGDHLMLQDPLLTPSLVAQYRQAYRLTAEHLGADIDELNEDQSERRIRWKAIVERIDRLANDDAAIAEHEVRGPAIDLVLARHATAVYGMLPVEEVSVSFWSVDRTWARWVVAIIIILVVWPALAWAIRPGLGTWMQEHPNASTGLLGIVWWLSLAPSIVGCAIVVVAIYRWASQVSGKTVITVGAPLPDQSAG